MLDDGAKAELLALARLTLETYLKTGNVPPYRPRHSELSARRGAFVSIHNAGELRGCIGQLAPKEELLLVVQSCVVSAATSDYRFAPVEASEAGDVEIEISVLTPFQRVASAEDVEVGKHGLLVAKGSRRGVLLPQVATEYGWDRLTFLSQTCRKAGLPETAWQDPGTDIYVFEAQVFSERDAPASH